MYYCLFVSPLGSLEGGRMRLLALPPNMEKPDRLLFCLVCCFCTNVEFLPSWGPDGCGLLCYATIKLLGLGVTRSTEAIA